MKKHHLHQSSERDQFTVVLEDLRSQFKVFGEGLDAVRDEMRGGFLKTGERLLKMEERLIKLESDMEFVKSELAVIRHNQITRDEFKLLEARVHKLERLVSHR